MALAPRAKNPLPSEAAEYVEDPPRGMRIGIALSGGGVRSAAFNLGALQALQKHHVLENADYLAAVSGGNYIASALTISAAYSDSDCENGKPLWAHGSPEERYLRQHTDYLAPGFTGRVWLGLSVVYGFVMNYLPFLLWAFIAGRLGGWSPHLLRSALSTFAGISPPAPGAIKMLLLFAASCCVLISVLLVTWRRLSDGHKQPGDYGETRSERIAAGLVTLAGAIGVVLALPALARLYATLSRLVLSRVLGEPADAFETLRARIMIAIVWLVVSLVLAVVALVLSRRFRARRLMLVLSSLAGAGLLLVPLLSSLDYSIRQDGPTYTDVLIVAGALVCVLVLALRVHNRHYSMHLLYRERLNSAFALRRTRDRAGRIIAQPIGYGERLYFSKIGTANPPDRAGRLPKLIVCCAVNLTSDEVPAGRFAASFTFEHDRSGGPLFDYRQTRRYEETCDLPGTQLTMPSIMAVSGAALSPLMGRFTYPPLRFLMALTNVRLGVWIKNLQHASWDSGDPPPEPRGRIARAAALIRRRWREPGALYVLREALGGLKSTHRFIYLTDGGHWENLGLVELLRRRCTHVLCFDASCDRTGAGLDIGRAIALARSELGADIQLNPRSVMPDAHGSSDAHAVAGAIRYPDQSQEAKLVYARAVLTEESSWDLHAFKARDGQFPNHPTSRQMFTDEQFEAYRTLGYAAGERALELLNIPAVLLRVTEPPADPGFSTFVPPAAGDGAAAGQVDADA